MTGGFPFNIDGMKFRTEYVTLHTKTKRAFEEYQRARPSKLGREPLEKMDLASVEDAPSKH